MNPLRLGTRGSALARWQADWVKARLAERGVAAELVIVKTRGDAEVDRPLQQLEGKGFFTKEIEEALLAERIDVAVHSLKDLPTEIPAGLALAAVPERADGFRKQGEVEVPLSLTFTGRLFGESDLLAVASAWQAVGGYHRRHPKL